MADLVVTCPKWFWKEWIAEGDAAGDPYTGEEWGWYTDGRQPPIGPGDRLYVVAWNRLRGFAPVTALRGLSFLPAHGAEHGCGVWIDVSAGPCEAFGAPARQWCICRRGDAQAITIPDEIPGFRGLRRVWWSRDLEVAFPDWKTADVPSNLRG